MVPSKVLKTNNDFSFLLIFLDTFDNKETLCSKYRKLSNATKQEGKNIIKKTSVKSISLWHKIQEPIRFQYANEGAM